jgi:chorismate mutase
MEVLRYCLQCMAVLVLCRSTPSSLAFGQWGPSSLVSLHKSSIDVSSGRQVFFDGVQTDVLVNGSPSDYVTSHAPTLTASRPAPDSPSNLKTVDVLSLDSIRSSLIRQEETIIFALIERAQFRRNNIAYEKGGFGMLGIPLGSNPLGCRDNDCMSLFEYMLTGTEALHCRIRRYTSPEEHPFFPERLPIEGPMEALPRLQYPNDLLSSLGEASELNFNTILLEKYMSIILPAIAKEGDDEQHGSTVLCDIAVLQALSRRIHYGKFVAESKYRSDPDEYQRLIRFGDAAGVMDLLTDAAVEEKVLRRARLKAATYGQEPLLSHMPPIEGRNNDTSSIVAAAAASAVVAALEALQDCSTEDGTPTLREAGKVNPHVIESIYRDIIIPLTKIIEVSYLFKRCGREPPLEYLP